MAPPHNTLRFDIASDPTSLDPLFAHQDANAVEQQLARLAFEPFIDIDDRGRSVPVLLDRIPDRRNGGLSADGRTIVYRLRHGIRWQDGVAVSSRDVLFTLRAILDDRNPVRSRAGYDLIDRASARDDQTVEIHLRRAWAPAVATFFSNGSAPQFVLPAHLLARLPRLAESAFDSAPIGNGPYRFRSWRRGERLVYEANAGYWRGRPRVDRLQIDVIPDPSTNLTLLRTGVLDWNLIAPSQQAVLRENASLRYRIVPLALVAGIVMNLRHPPLDAPAIRRAIAESIDRGAISRKITLGRYPVIDTAQPRSSWARDPGVAQPAYDPQAADRLFDAAGWRRRPDGMRTKDGRMLRLTYVQFPESQTGVRVATLVQSELRARGVDVTIKSISNAQLFLPAARGGTLASGNFDLAYVPFPMGADPDDAFLLRCDGASNYMHYCDRDVDRWETQALASTDRDVRRMLYARIERTVARDVPVLYLFNPSYVYAYDRRLSAFAPNAFSPTWNAAAWGLADTR